MSIRPDNYPPNLRRRRVATCAAGLLVLSSSISALRAEPDQPENKRPAKSAPEVPLKDVPIEPGAYEIHVSLEDADGTAFGSPIVETHCLTRSAGGGTHGFAVLHPTSVLRNCPSTNLREKGESLSFDIRCTGGNPARARATFNVFGLQFIGRIEVQAGDGSAMIAEIQNGRRVGSCPSP